MPSEKSSFLSLLIAVSSVLLLQKTKYNNVFREVPETFTTVPCFDFTLG